MRIYSDRAWKIAERYSHLLASETRDLAAQIDTAIGDALDDAAAVASGAGNWGIAGEILKMRPPKHES